MISKNMKSGPEVFWAEMQERLLVGSEIRVANITAVLGGYGPLVLRAIDELRSERIISRIWNNDFTVWKPRDEEISNRLGWLELPEKIAEEAGTIESLAKLVHMEGYKTVLLMGIGGSSLAPEVFGSVLGKRPGYPDLIVLDSTIPETIMETACHTDPEKTIHLVATKSGGTVETLSLCRYFYSRLAKKTGTRAGQNFIAITDPGSGLAHLAQDLHFRAVLFNDPNIGGRFSALSLFGLVPAALAGLEVSRLIASSRLAMNQCGPEKDAAENPAALLGAIIGELAKAGRDKLTLLFSQGLEPLGDWLEQLIAESTGKEGRGILPVTGEPLGKPSLYGRDRQFVFFETDDKKCFYPDASGLAEAGHPFIHIRLKNSYEIAAQMYIWEMATAVAAARLGINPFDQPNVESTKKAVRRIIGDLGRTGCIFGENAIIEKDGVSVYGIDGENPAQALLSFIGAAHGKNAYVCIQAFLARTKKTADVLRELAEIIRNETGCAVTLGFGPRYLHSTGQLHKGDSGAGIFIQFTAENPNDIEIPDLPGNVPSVLTFGKLTMAEALGDATTLQQAGRPIVRFHMSELGNLEELVSALRKLRKGNDR